MIETSIQISTDHFDGPLALLLLLIKKEEMSIDELDLGAITQQYLQYILNMQELDFDVAGEYLYLAATLLFLKSQSCVHEESDEKHESIAKELGITSRFELVGRLEELAKFQRLGQTLWQLPKRGHDVFCKPRVNRKAVVDSILTPLELEKLTRSMVSPP